MFRYLGTSRNMYRYIVLMSLIYALASKEVSKKKSYFEIRKKSLVSMQVTLQPQPKGSKVDKRYYANTAQNTHTYNKLINQPDLCSRHEKVFLLFAIRSTYKNFAMRYILREELNRQQFINYGKNIIVKHVFLFGKTDSFVTEQLIMEESRINKDIIQEDFPDLPENVPIKETMAWKWALEFCPNTEYVMIANDDVFVDIDKIVPFFLTDLSLGQPDNHVALCYLVGANKNFHRRMKTFKHMPQAKVYQGAFYPQHCHRFGYAVHINVASKLYKASLTNPHLIPTRIWVAILLEKLSLQVRDDKSRYAIYNVQNTFADPEYHSREVMIGHSEDNAYAGKQLQVMESVWSSLKRRLIKKVNFGTLASEKTDDGYRLQIQYAVLICLMSIILIILSYRYLRRCLARI